MQTGALPALPLDVGGGPLLKVRCFQKVSFIESLISKMNEILSLNLSTSSSGSFTNPEPTNFAKVC